MEQAEKRCILICAGDLTVSDIPVREGDLIIAVDGGYSYCGLLGIEPDVILGDFDSLTEEAGEALEKIRAQEPERIIRLDPVKDDTDTLAAIRYALRKGCGEFHFYGAMGGRLEHAIANLQCLQYLKNQGKTGYIWDGASMITLIQEESICFKESMEGMLSIFAFSGKAEGVTEKGLKYLLTDAVITTEFPIGVSNEFIGERAEVSVKKGSLLVIIRWE